jgi:hypothetical protein
VDSLSHAWSGEGGLLDKQGQLENSGKYRNSFATWREITPEHNKLVEQMLGSPAHIIATMRTKTEYVVEKDDRGKNSVRKLGLSPVQRDGMEYEFTLVMDVTDNHFARASKDRTSLFDGWSDRIGRQTGRMLRQWLDSGTDVASPEQQTVRTAAVTQAAPASVALTPRKFGKDEYFDDIPPLDDDPFPVGPATSSARDAINKAILLRRGKPTVTSWLDSFAADLELCTDRDEVEATVLRDDVCKASRTLTGEARARLQALIDAALAPFLDTSGR